MTDKYIYIDNIYIYIHSLYTYDLTKKDRTPNNMLLFTMAISHIISQKNPRKHGLAELREKRHFDGDAFPIFGGSTG